MVAPTPKFKSQEFKDALALLKGILDGHSLGSILLDALERKAAEQIFARLGMPTQGARIQDLKKAELVGRITAGFFSLDEIAYLVLKELDRACQKERHIVASIPEAHAAERIGSYRAIALKRERAKLVWALARDEREAVRALASKIIAEFFQETAAVETAKAIVEGSTSAAMEDVALAERLQEQAERLTEAALKVTALESTLSRFEDERARLLAQIGAKERQLKQESERRGEVEGQLGVLRRSLAEVETEQRVADAARASELEARQTAEELAQKVRRLSKLAAASKHLAETQEQLDQARRRVAELERALAKAEASEIELRQLATEKEAELKAQVEALREELHQTRRQKAESQHKERTGSGVLILLDQANLAAAAYRSFQRKVNFAALLPELAQGRPARGVAFVVDNGGTAFEAFCDTLRRAGWELRIKRPKTFVDGRTKADWDMGIAMEAVAEAERYEAVVLASGDGDFLPLLKHLQRQGKTVEVAAFPESLAGELLPLVGHLLGPVHLE